MYLTTQPIDHYTCICSFLQPKDIAILELTCKQFSNFQEKYISYFDQIKDIRLKFNNNRIKYVKDIKSLMQNDLKLKFLN